MKIDCIVLGDFQTNCYILRRDAEASKCLIIDPGMGPEPLIEFLRENALEPVVTILTHGHADHIVGVQLLRDKYPQIQTAVHELDAEMLTNPAANLSILTGAQFSTAPAEILLTDAQTLEYADLTLNVLHTPGHTPGGICLHSPGNALVFTDDTLFTESIGRTDFPGGNTDQLMASIATRLMTLPDETVIYPGHGPSSTIGWEKTHNPFL